MFASLWEGKQDTRNDKPDNSMLNMYKALVRPLLEFCTAAWSPHYMKDKENWKRFSADSQN